MSGRLARKRPLKTFHSAPFCLPENTKAANTELEARFLSLWIQTLPKKVLGSIGYGQLHVWADICGDGLQWGNSRPCCICCERKHHYWVTVHLNKGKRHKFLMGRCMFHDDWICSEKIAPMRDVHQWLVYPSIQYWVPWPKASSFAGICGYTFKL